MGDIADYYVGSMFDSDMENGYINRIVDDGGPLPTYHTCRYCGKDDLQWEETDKGWRLHETVFTSRGHEPVLHICPEYYKRRITKRP